MNTDQIENLDPSPWKPEQDIRRLRVLGKLIEELNELSSAAARCIIQGIDEEEPTTKVPNRTWLADEIADVWCNIQIALEVFELNTDYIEERTARKMHYLKKWLEM